MARRFYLIRDVWAFMKENKKWWLLPIFIILLVIGIFIFIAQSSSLSPLIYALI